jgi:hypothetical protein
LRRLSARRRLVLSSSSHCAAFLPSHCAIWCCVTSCRAVILSSSCPLTAPPSRCLIVQAGCCVISCRAVVLSSHHAALSFSCRPLTAPPSCRLIAPSGCCVASCCAVVLSSRLTLTPNVTCGTRNDGGHCPPPPRMLNVSSGWASPSRHRCPHHCPGCCFLPSNLVAVAISLAAVANACFVTCYPRPPLSPSPSPSPSLSPLP